VSWLPPEVIEQIRRGLEAPVPPPDDPRWVVTDPAVDALFRPRLEAEVPAKTKRQQRFMGAERARARAGKKTRTGMSASHLRKWARKPKGGYKKRKKR
jgi:hypothetical protein